MASSNPPESLYFNVPGVATVRWDESASMVYEEWEGWADTKEFMSMLNAGLQALKDHRGSHWLADCRLQRVLKPADQDWAEREWTPRAVAAGLKRFAVVLPASGLATTNLKSREAAWRAKGLDVGYFATVQEALDWLAK